jgi:nucleoid DNA-binding protein
MKLEWKEVYEEVSNKTGISKKDVEVAFRSVFEMVVSSMREEKGYNIMVPKMGKFVVPFRRLKYVNTEKYNEQLSRYFGGVEPFNSKRSRDRGDGPEEADGM